MNGLAGEKGLVMSMEKKGQKKKDRVVLFPLKCKPVRNKHQGSQQQAGHLSSVQRDSEEAHRATPVHGRAGDIEREPRDGGIHQDAEIVAQIGTRDAQRPHTREDENVSGAEEDEGEVRLVERCEEGLVLERLIVKVIAEDAQREDAEGEEIAAIVGASEYLG